MNARTKGQILALLREFDQLSMHAPDLKYGPSIFETLHDPYLHDEHKPCPHCRSKEIMAEVMLLVESA